MRKGAEPRHMPEEQKIPVIAGTAGNYPVFLGSATLADIAKHSFVDHLSMDTGQGVQRPLDKAHARKFREYITSGTKGKKATVPPLILSLRVPAKLKDGHLIMPGNDKAMARLDCQHRLANTGDVDVIVPFVIYHGLTTPEEIDIFTTINDQQKGLTKSLVDTHRLRLTKNAHDVEPHLAIAAELNKDSSSPWHDAVNTGGISTSTPGSKRRITMRTFQGAIKTLISGSRCMSAPYEAKYEAVKNFWYAVKATFPQAWDEPRKHLLVKGVGIAAVSELGRDVIQESLANEDTSIASYTEALSKLAGLDWDNKTSPFSLIGGQKGAAMAAKGLKAIVFGDLELEQLGDFLMPPQVTEEQE